MLTGKIALQRLYSTSYINLPTFGEYKILFLSWKEIFLNFFCRWATEKWSVLKLQLQHVTFEANFQVQQQNFTKATCVNDASDLNWPHRSSILWFVKEVYTSQEQEFEASLLVRTSISSYFSFFCKYLWPLWDRGDRKITAFKAGMQRVGPLNKQREVCKNCFGNWTVLLCWTDLELCIRDGWQIADLSWSRFHT